MRKSSPSMETMALTAGMATGAPGILNLRSSLREAAVMTLRLSCSMTSPAFMLSGGMGKSRSPLNWASMFSSPPAVRNAAAPGCQTAS